MRGLIGGADAPRGTPSLFPDKDAPGAKTIQDKIRESLRIEPGMPYDRLTERAYGESTKDTRTKLRAQIHAMKRRGYLEEMEPGRYRLAG